jgi:hypothetical protein
MQRENNALVLYSGNGLVSGDLIGNLGRLYYVPVCPPPGTWSSTKKGLVCTVGSWSWAVNTGGNSDGVHYADNVGSNLQ